MRLLPVHTHIFITEPNYRIQYKNAYYISIEGSELQLGSHTKGWHKDWFIEWDTTKRE